MTWMSREQMQTIDEELSATIEHLLVHRSIDVTLLIRALNQASIELAECLESVRGEGEW